MTALGWRKRKQIMKNVSTSDTSQERVDKTAKQRHEQKSVSDVEPVAWGMPSASGDILDVISLEEHARVEGGYTVPLYTTQPPVTEPHKRQCNVKPLTDEQIDLLLLHHEMMNQWPKQKQIHTFVRAIEAAHGIKEKNT